ncbi:hypothetical protein ACOME3_001833 [Neoechinorhynchus agilis]
MSMDKTLILDSSTSTLVNESTIDHHSLKSMNSSSNLMQGATATRSYRMINYEDVRHVKTTKDFYDDFQTIDWLKDLKADRERHQSLREHRGCLRKMRTMIDAWSGWVLVFFVGALAGLLAGVVDIGTNWIGSLREGICLEAFWLDREHCCWSSINVTFDSVQNLLKVIL